MAASGFNTLVYSASSSILFICQTTVNHKKLGQTVAFMKCLPGLVSIQHFDLK